MQTLKENVLQRILLTARKEFISQGVKDASIRTIASKANVSVGTIYKYFKSKDELFCAVLQPLLTKLNRHMHSHNDERFLNLEVFTSPSLSIDYLNQTVSLVKTFRPELKLLLFQAAGTSLDRYLERILAEQIKIGEEYLSIMKSRWPHIDAQLSPFFIHILCSTWTNILRELVLHDEFSDSEIKQALIQYAHFSLAGWKELLKPFK